MNHLILPYFILFVAIFQFIIRKNSKKTKDKDADFWKRETESNFVRKKDISNLDYIKIPDSLLSIKSDIPEVERALSGFAEFSGKKMLNLTGMTNTDLKMSYGPANLDALSAYDENCTGMLRSLVSAAKALYDNDMKKEACEFLEFGIKCGSDITANYTMLADYYASCGNKEGIRRLIKAADSLNSLTKSSIIKKLKASLSVL